MILVSLLLIYIVLVMSSLGCSLYPITGCVEIHYVCFCVYHNEIHYVGQTDEIQEEESVSE